MQERPLDDFLEDAADEVERALKRLSRAERGDDEAAETAIARAVRRLAHDAFGKRPLVEAVILRA
ncbi:MAG: hypothetical protein MI723_06275 [Caulobacterales bacterium]|nr:hypothetical protein [Caulobacterales bacterium]